MLNRPVLTMLLFLPVSVFLMVFAVIVTSLNVSAV
ncbi:Uncharacterized protein BM_BM498 [Brugia malayi]|uniref:ABC transporter permease n=1 Tax=Brugia malayi TaxID=6279 RepID=A0A0J9XWK7_BRUMA|nr:Uncharacterized protein BM_BM498 [Brugia malayi]CDP96637.1 Bm498 [Brugia malayi]VIO92233.1 Uncharacterized protein BM_BM498 [Brugia malayi]